MARMVAESMKGADGKFYIVPISAGMTGFSFRTRGEAEQIVQALNAAYFMGREEVKREMRDIIGVDDD